MDRTSINVLLVDDHALVRRGIQAILESDPMIHVTGQARDVSEAMELIRRDNFDVALVDISLPGKSGIDLLRMLQTENAKPATLILTTYAEDLYAVRALRYGASGYLSKDSPAESLIEAVKSVSSGGKCISSAICEKLPQSLDNEGDTDVVSETLSEREMEVLRFIAHGTSLQDIATTLQLSPNTVATYRARIMKKTGVNSDANLAIYANETGLRF